MIGVGSALISLFLALVCYSLTLTAKRADEEEKRKSSAYQRLSEKEKNIWKSCFFLREYPRKNACRCEKSDYGQGK